MLGAVGTLAPALLALAACGGSSDDDDAGGQTAPGSDAFASAFHATLDEVQVVPEPRAGTRLLVTATNRAPADGTLQSAVWLGFHDGTFELYDSGEPADTWFPVGNALERLAEDGATEPLAQAFAASQPSGVQRIAAGVLGGPTGTLAPGETVSVRVELDPSSPHTRYLSVASAVGPANDAFVAPDDPTAHPLFGAGGELLSAGFTVPGAAVLDAGTEVNDEAPANVPWLGPESPNGGVDELGVVALHEGLAPPGSGGVLDDPRFAGADFQASGYETLAIGVRALGSRPAARGIATVELRDGDTAVACTVSATSLSGPITALALHAAQPGVTGAAVLELIDAVVRDADGELWAEAVRPATPELLRALRGGALYVHVATALNPTGELRGQVHPTPAFTGRLERQQTATPSVLGRDVRVAVRNLAPAAGTFQSPIWIGFHDGTFDLVDVGVPADVHFPVSRALERLAEDGDAGPLRTELAGRVPGAVDGVIAGLLQPGPLAPGETVVRTFRLDPTGLRHRYLAWASGVWPSNDAFAASADPTAWPVQTGTGALSTLDVVVRGADVLDAGTEVNDELPEHTVFFGQTEPDSGIEAQHVVYVHDGYLPAGSGGVLDDPTFAAADFRAPGYELLRLRVVDPGGTPVEPAGLATVTLSAGGRARVALGASALSGPPTAVHLHVGAPGTEGPIVIDLTGSMLLQGESSVWVAASLPVDRTIVDALRTGRAYVDVHTALNPKGELRAQLAPGE